MKEELEQWNKSIAEGERLVSDLRKRVMKKRDGIGRRLLLRLLRFSENWVARGFAVGWTPRRHTGGRVMVQVVTGSTKTQTNFRKDSRRYRMLNRSTKKYLHMSGRGEVEGTDFAWSGTVEQARALKRRAEVWPYVGVRA